MDGQRDQYGEDIAGRAMCARWVAAGSPRSAARRFREGGIQVEIPDQEGAMLMVRNNCRLHRLCQEVVLVRRSRQAVLFLARRGE